MIEAAANRLARMLRGYPWYHRTTMGWIYDGSERNRLVGARLSVWAEGKSRPTEIPKKFEGFAVKWERVTKRRPCPFGSVRA